MMKSTATSKCAVTLLAALLTIATSGCVSQRPSAVLHASKQFLMDRRLIVTNSAPIVVHGVTNVPWKVIGVTDPSVVGDLLYYINDLESQLATCRAKQ